MQPIWHERRRGAVVDLCFFAAAAGEKGKKRAGKRRAFAIAEHFEAADYLLSECDYAYLNASGLVDKSLPRMLALSQNAEKITLVGPCAPLWPGFAWYGVQDVSGLVITDAERAMRMAAGVEQCKPFAAGRKVALRMAKEE